MYSLWYSDTYGKTKQRALQRVKPGTVSGWQCASSWKTGMQVRSIKKAMEALHITCVDEETATCVCAGLDAAHQVQNPAAYS